MLQIGQYITLCFEVVLKSKPENASWTPSNLTTKVGFTLTKQWILLNVCHQKFFHSFVTKSSDVYISDLVSHLWNQYLTSSPIDFMLVRTQFPLRNTKRNAMICFSDLGSCKFYWTSIWCKFHNDYCFTVAIRYIANIDGIMFCIKLNGPVQPSF